MPKLVARVKDFVAEQRRRRPWIDHAVRTVTHYIQSQGNQLAGAMTYFAFLSLFPLIAIAFAVTGTILGFYPEAQDQLETALEDNLPGLTGPDGIDVEAIAEAGSARLSAGIIGALGLLYSGLGFIDALRRSLRTMWAVAPVQRNLALTKLVDVVALVTLGATFLVTTATSSLATSATTWVLDQLGLQSGGFVEVLLQVVAVLLAVGANTVILIVVFARLPGHKLPWRNVWTGALLGAIGVEILKQLAALILGTTSSNPVYGTFAGIVTVLVWINLVSRVVMYAAAWSVTGPVPTVEAEVAASGEVLDTGAADAAERAREEHPDDAEVPLDRPHRTTAGDVPLTTTGIVEEPEPPERAGPADRTAARHAAGPAGWLLALAAVLLRRRSARDRGDRTEV